MQDFYYNTLRAEIQIIDPLILNRNLIKDRIIAEVENRDMEKRRYAISFLGIAEVEDALPVLRAILRDSSELDYFRADALESIFLISRKEGLAKADQYKNREDSLGYIAKGMADGSHKPFVRTYFQALTSYKD